MAVKLQDDEVNGKAPSYTQGNAWSVGEGEGMLVSVAGPRATN